MSELTIEYTPHSKRHLRAISRYTQNKWGKVQRVRYNDQLFAGIEAIRLKPGIGKSRDDIRNGLRSFRVEQHIVFYKVLTTHILIVAVLHGRMVPELHIPDDE